MFFYKLDKMQFIHFIFLTIQKGIQVTKKELMQHALIVTATGLIFAAAMALAAFLFIEVGIIGHITYAFLHAANCAGPVTHPSGLAAGGILMFGGAAILGVAALPFVSAYYTHKKLSKLCFGKTEMPKTKQAELAHHAMCVVAKEQHHAHEEMQAIQNSNTPLGHYPIEFPLFSTRLTALNTALKENKTPNQLISLAQECQLARDNCNLMRKSFSQNKPKK